MLNYIHNLFGKHKPTAKPKTIKQKLLGLKLGSYVAITLNPDICSEHIKKGIERFDLNVLQTHQLKGLVKAVYTSDDTGFVYVEIVGLIVNNQSATRKEYVVMEIEVSDVVSL